jgi:hypothetical protein
MALAMPIHACEHSTFAIGRRAPRGVGVGVGAAAQEQTAGMGLVRRFSRPLRYFFGLWPVVLHGGALFFTTFSRRRVLSPLRSGQRLHLSVKMLRRFVEISKQGRAQPALHIEVRRAIPITAVLIGPYPIKLILMTGEGRRGEYQPEATISVGDVRDHAIDRPYVSLVVGGGSPMAPLTVPPRSLGYYSECNKRLKGAA